MPFDMHKKSSFLGGMVRINWTERGMSSYSIHPIPGYRKISWNSRSGRWSWDLPGPINWKSKGKSTRRRRR